MYHCLLFRKLKRISSLHVLCSCLNNMLFLEINVACNIRYHAIFDVKICKVMHAVFFW